MEMQDQERRRIARDLHDSAGQTIALLLMSIRQMLKELKPGNPDLVKLVNESRVYAEELNREIRTTSYLLHPPLLDEIGLRAALDWYVDGLRQRAGLDVEVNIGPEFERLSRHLELTVFRVIQECLTNIHRHSGSKTAHISIVRDDANVVVQVRDNGRGIAAEKLSKIQAKGVGVGLRGIFERVRQFAGQVHIKSQEGRGTTVVVSLPLAGPN
jgi:signal transduction histidine kinase